LTPFAEATGVVSSFDEPRGLGVIRDEGGETVPFHCTAIADGSRSITVGQPVRFTVVAGRLGRWEADRIVAR
jgi:cold shock protein